MFSTYALHYPSRSVFDCGDGAARDLGQDAFAAERVLLSHNHSDHISSLPSFIGNRSSMKGSPDKPLTVYAPESRSIKAYRDLIFTLYPRLKFPLTFETIHGGSIIPLDEKRYIEAFDVSHAFNSVGYKVVEKRQRLKTGVKPEDARALKAQGVSIHEDYNAVSFAWLLDSARFDLGHIENAQTVVFDATFMRAADRDDQTHASVDEVLNWAKDAKVKHAILAHVSTRYPWQEARAYIAEAVTRIGYIGVVDVILGDKVYDI